MAGNSPTGVIPRVYKSGSIIYFEGDKSEYIYILKSGRVVLTYIKLDTGEEVKEDVRHGEFFGVKSALGRYPREETAQVIGETVVLIFQLADFERLILRNVNVVRKMLRVFSNQLRRIGKMVRSVLGETDTVNPDVELFKLGEYYYNAGQLEHSEYVFKKYMEYYPDTEYSPVAMKRIKAIASGQAVPAAGNSDSMDFDSSFGGEDPIQSPGMSDGIGDEMSDMDDFSIDEPADSGDMFDFNDDGGGGGEKSELSNEMDDFLADDSSETMDDFSFDEPGEEDSDPSGMVDEAMEHYSTGNYSYALDIYKRILESGNVEELGDIYEKASYEIGRCQFEMGSQKEALQSFSGFIKGFPGSANVKNALFQIGAVFESVGQGSKALSYYKKVASLAPKDKLSQDALRKTRELENV
ncbi:MAG: cyclic nucleotide-binding domain-containing protein [bacterium]|nr:cyclic nucleotide-binding domain-containing protein [bacterium]